jgi:type VI secretion system secreted protein VgrG
LVAFAIAGIALVAVAAIALYEALKSAKADCDQNFGTNPVGSKSCASELDTWRESHKPAVDAALKKQKEMLENKKAALERWNEEDQAEFKKWFGTTDNNARDKIKSRIDKELDLNSKTTINNFKPATPDEKDCYAYVQPNDKSHTVYLGDDWENAAASGTNSKPGTLTHEMSHFSDVGGTDDHQYGTSGCKELAKNDPDLAQNNADSFEYYVEGAN